MPAAPDADVAAGAAATTDSGLVVRAFRGVRYDPDRVSDLAAVTSPPYDVIDPESATHLEELDPHNVVRLILPREGADASRYVHARGTLDDWIARGVLRRDEQPALYVYEQHGQGLLQRGLVAAVGLRDPAERVVLPHEDVMPAPVADRLALMRATSANLEPILLAYDGGGATAEIIDSACRQRPLLETCTEDGLTQRVWAVTEPDVQAEVAADLAPRQALIADGHHRYETYRRLQAEHHTAGHGPGDWDFGLALLVDIRRYPLRVQAIHRVVAGLGLAEAVQRAQPVFAAEPVGSDLGEAFRRLTGEAVGDQPLQGQPLPGEPLQGQPLSEQPLQGQPLSEQPLPRGNVPPRATSQSVRHAFLVTDGADFVLLHDPDPAAVDRAVPGRNHSATWRSLDASVLHGLLLAELWEVNDPSGRIGYVHDVVGALRAAARADGVAVLMRPVELETVHALAARGERMPRKSTSFGPKPRTGLILRLVEP